MTGARILVVEDEVLVAMMTIELLRAEGYDVAGPAIDHDEAIALADEFPPDLVLMDIRLRGGTDGIETARTLQDRHGCRIVFVTGQGDRTTRERALKLEPRDLVRKPFSPEQLTHAVATALME